MNKSAQVDFTVCNPENCGNKSGVCEAAHVCSHKLLIQEEPDEAPFVLSQKLCSGCGKCVLSCPLGAIEITNG